MSEIPGARPAKKEEIAAAGLTIDENGNVLHPTPTLTLDTDPETGEVTHFFREGPRIHIPASEVLVTPKGKISLPVLGSE